MGEDLLDFVVSVGATLRRSQEDVTPYHKILEDNWYDTVEILADVKPEQLVTLGIPLRFANALVEAAADGGDAAPARSEKGKGKGKKGKKRSKDDHRSSKGRGDDLVSVIDLDDVDPGFNLKGKLLGHKGQNVHHIQDETGVKVYIDQECRRMEITGTTREGLEQAEEMCQDLIRVSYEDYDEWLSSNGNSSSDGTERKGKGKGKDRKGDKDKGKGKGKGKGKDRRDTKDGAYTEIVEVERCEKGFRLRGKIVGENGKNVYYIQDQSQAKVSVEDDGEEVQVRVSADDPDKLAQAVQMTKDLITTVMEEYDEWQAQAGGEDAEDGDEPSSGKGKRKGKKGKKGKGKGKGKKRKDYDDDEPPAKRQRT